MPEPQAAVDADVDAALERLGHNTGLYASILTSYLEEIATLPDQLDSSLLAGDLTGATRLLHTLKGLSATVGASELAQVARQLESVLKTADASLAHDTLRATLRKAVRRAEHTMGEIAARFAEPPIPLYPGASPDHAALRPDLIQLRELLNNSDLRAIEMHTRLRHALGQSAPLALQELDSAMAAFDFTRGVVCCDQMLKQLDAAVL